MEPSAPLYGAAGCRRKHLSRFPETPVCVVWAEEAAFGGLRGSCPCCVTSVPSRGSHLPEWAVNGDQWNWRFPELAVASGSLQSCPAPPEEHQLHSCFLSAPWVEVPILDAPLPGGGFR